jgi:hypothetical protein
VDRATPCPIYYWCGVSSTYLALSLLFLVSQVGCGQPDATDNSPAAASAERIRHLEEQISAGRGRQGWEPWYEALSKKNRNHIAADFLFFATSERVLYDQALIDRISDTSALEDPSRAEGPLVMILDVARQLKAKDIDLLLMPVPPRAAVYPEHIGIEAPPRFRRDPTSTRLAPAHLLQGA